MFSGNSQQTISVENKVTITHSTSPRRVLCHPNADSVFDCRLVTKEEFERVENKLGDFNKAQRTAFGLGFLEHGENLKYIFPETEKRICGNFFAEVLGISLRTIQLKVKSQKVKEENEEEIAVSVFNH